MLFSHHIILHFFLKVSALGLSIEGCKYSNSIYHLQTSPKLFIVRYCNSPKHTPSIWARIIWYIFGYGTAVQDCKFIIFILFLESITCSGQRKSAANIPIHPQTSSELLIVPNIPHSLYERPLFDIPECIRHPMADVNASPCFASLFFFQDVKIFNIWH